MRTSTIPFASVRVTAQEAAKEVTRLMMHPRDARIQTVGAPRDKQVHDRRRKIDCGQAVPAFMLLELSLTDLADRLPLAEVLEPYYFAIAFLTAAHEQGRGMTPALAPLLPLQIRETRSQARLDEAQQRALANPDDPNALAEVEQRSAAYDADQEAYIAEVRRRRIALTSGSRRVPVPA